MMLLCALATPLHKAEATNALSLSCSLGDRRQYLVRNELLKARDRAIQRITDLSKSPFKPEETMEDQNVSQYVPKIHLKTTLNVP